MMVAPCQDRLRGDGSGRYRWLVMTAMTASMSSPWIGSSMIRLGWMKPHMTHSWTITGPSPGRLSTRWGQHQLAAAGRKIVNGQDEVLSGGLLNPPGARTPDFCVRQPGLNCPSTKIFNVREQ
jgi:hypothetical protein